MSLPVREVWIEMFMSIFTAYLQKSLPVREVWIEIGDYHDMQKNAEMSLPVREVWIEIGNNGVGKG